MSESKPLAQTRPIIAICGSMAFLDEMEHIALLLEGAGCEALAPVREEHGVDGYVGPNTLMEAAFAYAQGIPVIFLHDPFEQASGLECASISRGFVNGDASAVLQLI